MSWAFATLCIALGAWVSIGTAVFWSAPEDIPPDRWPPQRGYRRLWPKPHRPEEHTATWRKAKRDAIGSGVLLVVFGVGLLAYLIVR